MIKEPAIKRWSHKNRIQSPKEEWKRSTTAKSINHVLGNPVKLGKHELDIVLHYSKHFTVAKAISRRRRRRRRRRWPRFLFRWNRRPTSRWLSRRGRRRRRFFLGKKSLWLPSFCRFLCFYLEFDRFFFTEFPLCLLVWAEKRRGYCFVVQWIFPKIIEFFFLILPILCRLLPIFYDILNGSPTFSLSLRLLWNFSCFFLKFLDKKMIEPFFGGNSLEYFCFT